MKISQMFKNIRYLLSKLGSTDISSIGDGSVTGALSSLNNNLTVTAGELQISSGWTTTAKWVKRTGKVVEFYTELSGGSLIANGWTTIATFPAGYQPNAAFDFTGLDNKTGGAIQTKVNSSSNALQIYSLSSQTNANLRLHGLYIIA